LVENIFDNTKLIPVPDNIAEELTKIANRKGISVSVYATEVLLEALRAENLGADLKHAVDLWRLVSVHKNAGNLNIPRSNFGDLIKLHVENGKKLKEIWYDSGRWYGAYCTTQLDGDNIFSFLEKDLLLSWNLDEVEIRNEDPVLWIRCASFSMSVELTDLLVVYLLGLFNELDYSESERDVLRGLVQIRFLKNKEY
jgi:hypothetical protein